jgi:hypothetical protein
LINRSRTLVTISAAPTTSVAAWLSIIVATVRD